VNEIKNRIIENLNSRCRCSVTAGLVTNPRLLCQGGSKAAVSFRANLHGSSSLQVDYLQDLLEGWLNETTSSISVGAIEYNIEDFCSSIQDSDADQECVYPHMISVTNSTQDSTLATGGPAVTTQASGGPSTIVIIVGVVAGVLVILILTVACGVVFCVVIYARTKHPSEDLR
jgi:hypothetical protein